MSFDVPFPEGVVDSDFFLNNFLPNNDRRLAAAMIDDLKIFDRLPLLMSKLKKGPITLSDGTILRVEKTPRFSKREFRRYQFESLEGVSGPSLAIERNGVLTVAAITSGGYSLLVNQYDESRVERETPHLFPTTHMTYDRFEGLSPSGSFRNETSLTSLEAVAQALDVLSLDGQDHVRIAKAVEANLQKRNHLVGEYVLRAGWISKFREIAALVQKLGEQSFNDHDLTVGVGKVFKRLDPWHFGKIVVKGRDPWLVVQNFAGVVSYAVRLKPLEQGVLEMKIIHEREEPLDFKIGADGKVLGVDGRASYYLGPVDDDTEYLLEQLQWQLRRRHKRPDQ